MAICRTCQSDQVPAFLHFDRMPLAGAFLDGPADMSSETFHPLTVRACDSCGLIQVAPMIPPEILFRRYNFMTGSIPSLVEHFTDYAGFIARELKAANVVEFGCNDGTLLAALGFLGVRAFGVDPAGNVLELARKRGVEVEHGYFDEAMAERLLMKLGPVDLVTGSNCFAHNPDQRPILRAARRLLREGGLLAIECMYAGDLLEQLQWDTLYHEHLVVYSLGSISAVLGQEGFTVVDVDRVPMHAGSLRVFATPSGPSVRPGPRVTRMAEMEASTRLNRSATWREFGDLVQRRIRDVGEVLRQRAESNTVWAYGASGRATMWLNAANLDFVRKVVDSSPLRVGKLMPGLHQPIVSPEEFHREQPDMMLVTAWNYFSSIRAKERQFSGQWVLPLPSLVFQRG
ncbi:hypothetical protein CU669_08990 [Paramagnetospirillum kuznetsovii]|uniref:Class I SAM-dependent methyltransferase n=1 Tax=Paramagnetospirillum kuznetsovii TaxID=2053833 RepID=A0A364NYV5_9PROT|nr:class I SAM-dependent methyltransferase [Paramagnetospirillum kuznetsovii]RAU22252.1 hypothetical protein CU669_08990 [Paramagnetospirillum kuznetsovii]